jgi:large subunit ribosomal protein L27
MGRDHTIYATESGYVKYYKDPEKNPKRQYIGVVFERDQVLPLPRNAPRRRKLNMVANKMELPPTETIVRTDMLDADGKMAVQVKTNKGVERPELKLRPGGMYRESNWEIGRAAERANVKVRAFKPRDRWVAWRKANIRKQAIQEKKNLGRKKGKK